MMLLSWQIRKEIVVCDGWDVQQCTAHRNYALGALNWDVTALEGVAFISYSVAVLFWDAITSVMQGKHKPRKFIESPHLQKCPYVNFCYKMLGDRNIFCLFLIM